MTSVLLLLASALSAAPTDAGTGITKLCDPMSPEAIHAREALASIDRLVRERAKQTLLNESLSSALENRCFAFARENERLPNEETHPFAWKHWWENGGRAWLENSLAAAYGETGPQRVVLPADLLPVLSLETAQKDDPLRPLLCPFAEPSCGAETAIWRKLAETAPPKRFSDDRAPEPIAVVCQRAANESYEPYLAWRICLENIRPEHEVFPLGHFKAPADGWLVVRGRRGHYDFCDESRAYDLVTGAAYVAQSCSGLALQKGGTVNTALTDKRRTETLLAGTVNRELLRRVAWLILFKDRATDRQAEPLVMELPAGMRRVLDEDREDRGGQGHFGAWMHTGQTQLDWQWSRSNAALVSGSLTWPESSQAIENLAAQWLDEAEKTLVQGCPPATLPEHIFDASGVPGVSHLDAPAGVDTVQSELVKRLRALRTNCKSAH